MGKHNNKLLSFVLVAKKDLMLCTKKSKKIALTVLLWYTYKHRFTRTQKNRFITIDLRCTRLLSNRLIWLNVFGNCAVFVAYVWLCFRYTFLGMLNCDSKIPTRVEQDPLNLWLWNHRLSMLSSLIQWHQNHPLATDLIGMVKKTKK